MNLFEFFNITAGPQPVYKGAYVKCRTGNISCFWRFPVESNYSTPLYGQQGVNKNILPWDIFIIHSTILI